MATKNEKTDTAKAADGSMAAQEEIEGVFVRCAVRGRTFRRAGFEFTHEGMGIALEALTPEQLLLLEREPMLVVEHCTFGDAELRVILGHGEVA